MFRRCAICCLGLERRKMIAASIVILAVANMGAAVPQFRPRVSLNVGEWAYGTAAGDFDGDGRMDLAVGNNLQFQIKVFYGQADGSLGSPYILSTPGNTLPSHLASADINGDGRCDLIFNNQGLGVAYGQTGRTFTSVQNYYVAGAQEIAAGDLNGDGRPDVVAVGGSSVTGYYSQPSGGLAGAWTCITGDSNNWVFSRGIAIADFNLDGRTDIAVTNPYDSTMSLLYGQTGGGFSKTDYPLAYRSVGIVSGDFNRDGRPDLAYAAYSGAVGVLLGQVNGFSSPALFDATSRVEPSDIASGDFNRDGFTDLVLVTGGHSTVTLLMGAGDGTFGGRMNLYASANGSASVTVADLDGNGWDDIAVASASGIYADVFYGVPEPSTLVLLGVGAISLLADAWRRRRA